MVWLLVGPRSLAAGIAATATGPDVAERAEPVARGVAPGRGAGDAAIRASLSGQSLVLAHGVPVTVVDGGAQLTLRAPVNSTVSDTLDLAGIQLGPLDQVVAPEGRAVASGDLIRVLRVVETDAVVREAVPFGTITVADPSLSLGRSFVVTAGVAGLAENTYRVRIVDGAEADRTLLSSTVLAAPVNEVRHIGTLVPAGPSEVEAIIRSAAATWGADPNQLLRVAYCESRYNPSAYNASSGASGLFQFLARTWAANSVRAGYGGASVFDPVANANTAAMMFAAQQAGQWSCK